MKRFVMNVLVFSAVFAAADGIKCYVCTGTEDDCAKDILEANKAKYLTTCSFLFDRCIRVWAKKDSITTVVNACSNKAVCDATKKACDNTTDGQCAVSCCTTDECNAGSAGVPTDGIKCYACIGTEDVCAKDKLKADKAKYLMTCSSSFDRCMRVWAKKDDTTAVINACSNRAKCDDTKKACDGITETDGQCDVSCCQTDECNAGSAVAPTDGIKCYVCTGTEDDCAKDKLEADKAKYLNTCSSPSDRCIRVWAKKDSTTTVTNSCSSKAGCDVGKKVCDAYHGPCDVSCCLTDECNVGSAVSSVSFSGFVMTVCSILGLALFNQALP